MESQYGLANNVSVGANPLRQGAFVYYEQTILLGFTVFLIQVLGDLSSDRLGQFYAEGAQARLVFFKGEHVSCRGAEYLKV